MVLASFPSWRNRSTASRERTYSGAISLRATRPLGPLVDRLVDRPHAAASQRSQQAIVGDPHGSFDRGDPARDKGHGLRIRGRGRQGLRGLEREIPHEPLPAIGAEAGRISRDLQGMRTVGTDQPHGAASRRNLDRPRTSPPDTMCRCRTGPIIGTLRPRCAGRRHVLTLSGLQSLSRGCKPSLPLTPGADPGQTCHHPPFSYALVG